MTNYQKYNAEEVLKVVEEKIEFLQGKNTYNNKLYIDKVCDELSIFDWWNDWLSISQLKDMRKFLKQAIKLGFTGHVCFKVGVKGYANGMWANKKEITNGYSPDGDFIYKSFVNHYNYWDIKLNDEFITNQLNLEYDELTTIKKLNDALKQLNN